MALHEHLRWKSGNMIHQHREVIKTAKRWSRLIPAILVIYIIAYIDRVNMGFGLQYIQEDLSIDGAKAGFAAGIFFIGYLVLQVPGGYLAQKWSVRKLVFTLMIGWGICAVLCGFVHSYHQLVALRFLLGVFEGGVQPALMVLISRWFPKAERGRAFSLFIMHNPIATLITGPFAGVILRYGTWRELFILQGLLPLVIGIGVWWFVSADRPEDAKWLSNEELSEIKALKAADGDVEVQSDPRLALGNLHVWYLGLLGMLVWLGFYGLQLWLPSLLKTVFQGDLTVGFVAAIPPVVAAFAIWFNGRGADKDKRYTIRVGVPLIIGGIVLCVSTSITADMRWGIVIALAVATACQLSFFGPYWTINSTLLPPAAIGIGYGIINGLGNLGGLLGPYLGGYLSDKTGSLGFSSICFGLAVVVAGVMALGLTRAVKKKLV